MRIRLTLALALAAALAALRRRGRRRWCAGRRAGGLPVPARPVTGPLPRAALRGRLMRLVPRVTGGTAVVCNCPDSDRHLRGGRSRRGGTRGGTRRGADA